MNTPPDRPRVDGAGGAPPHSLHARPLLRTRPEGWGLATSLVRGHSPGGLFHPTLVAGTQMLEKAGISNPRWVAEQLLAWRLGISRLEMLLEPAPLSEEIRARFLADAAACAAGVPMQYVLGTAAFYGREFEVGPGVFIPRPETEVLVETALELISVRGEPVEPRERFCVLDVGTGSGAIGITLALERPGIRVLVTDRSEVALAFARRNAQRLALAEAPPRASAQRLALAEAPPRASAQRPAPAVDFFLADLAEGFPAGSIDLLAANLPYLDAAQAPTWPRELHWEPWLAQDGGERGTALIGRLIRESGSCLAAGGRMVLEIGDGQHEEIGGIARAAGLQVERVVPDRAGRDRVLLLRRNS